MNKDFLNVLTNNKEVKDNFYEDDYKTITVLDDCVEIYIKSNQKTMKINIIKFRVFIYPIRVEQLSLYYNDIFICNTVRFKKGTPEEIKQLFFEKEKNGIRTKILKVIKFKKEE